LRGRKNIEDILDPAKYYYVKSIKEEGSSSIWSSGKILPFFKIDLLKGQQGYAAIRLLEFADLKEKKPSLKSLLDFEVFGSPRIESFGEKQVCPVVTFEWKYWPEQKIIDSLAEPPKAEETDAKDSKAKTRRQPIPIQRRR